MHTTTYHIFSKLSRLTKSVAMSAVIIVGLLFGAIGGPVSAQEQPGEGEPIQEEPPVTSPPTVPPTVPPTTPPTTRPPATAPPTAPPTTRPPVTPPATAPPAAPETTNPPAAPGTDPSVVNEPPSLSNDPRLDSLRNRRTENTNELWSAQYSDEELDLWVTALSEILQEKETKLAETNTNLANARSELRRLENVIQSIEKKIEALESVVRGRVVQTYMAAGSENTTMAMLMSSEKPVDMEFRQFLVGIANSSDKELLDGLSERKAAAKDEQKRAEETEKEVLRIREEANAEVEEVAKIKTDIDALKSVLDVRAGEIRNEIEALAQEEGFLRVLLGYPDDTGGVPTTVERPASTKGLIWPVAGTLTSVFGMRWGALHAGIDVAAPTGTPIYASTDGTVIFSGTQGGYGNIVVLDHGDNFHTAYAHMSRTAAVNGSRVLRGELIGLVGSTGNSTGPHLHFETRVQGKAYDPMQFLPNR